MTAHEPRIDLYKSSDGWRWRLWVSSSKVGASSEAYVKRSAAIRNLETVTGGVFEKVSTPESPTPYGMLRRHTLRAESNHDWSSIPVRLVVEP